MGLFGIIQSLVELLRLNSFGQITKNLKFLAFCLMARVSCLFKTTNIGVSEKTKELLEAIKTGQRFEVFWKKHF